MPDYGNPQSLNRYSYVINNPLLYTDPTGHMFASGDYEDSDGKCGKKDKGCNDLKTRIERKKKDRENNWPDNPPWDGSPAPIQKRSEIDILLDPWAGMSYHQAFTNPVAYYSGIHDLSALSWDAYDGTGIDLSQVMKHPADNKLTEYQAGDILPALLTRKAWKPYNDFLKALELGTGPEHITNYEPRYLEALMTANPNALEKVKTAWLTEAEDPILGELRQVLQNRGGLMYTQR